MGLLNVRLVEQVWRVDDEIAMLVNERNGWEAFVHSLHNAEADIQDVDCDMEFLCWIITGPGETLETMISVVSWATLAVFGVEHKHFPDD